MKRFNQIVLITAFALSALLTGCEVTIEVNGDADIEVTNSIEWDGVATDLSAVHIGTSVDDALTTDTLGALAAGQVMEIQALDSEVLWTIIASDAAGNWYVSTDTFLIGGLTSFVTLTQANYDEALTQRLSAPVEPEPEPEPEPSGAVGDLTVTNSVDWAGVGVDFVSATVSGGDFAQTIDMGIETGFAMQDLPAGAYSVVITDNTDTNYDIADVPVEADSETALDVVIAYATAGAINFTNSIDNLDGDEVYVVGLYATPPDGNVVDLAGEKNWLEGAEVGFDQSAVAIGVPVGSYQLIVADFDDNYYVKTDVGVEAGAVTDVTVTADDRDPELTLALN